MSGRLQGKIAIIVGAGQSSGETIGNGRAMAVLFARHGAQVLCVDRRLESAAETVAMITAEGGGAVPFQADVSRDAGCAAVVADAKSRWGRIDILVNNVGIGGNGDGPAHRADEAAWDRIMAVNLKSAWMMIKHTIPIMREQTGSSMLVMTLILTLSAAAIAIGVVYNNARIALSMRSRDLASLRVLGFTRLEISSILLGELAAQVLLGIPLGLLFGTGLARLLAASMDPEAIRFQVHIAAHTYVEGAVIALISGLVSALLVRRKLDRLDLVGVLKSSE